VVWPTGSARAATSPDRAKSTRSNASLFLSLLLALPVSAQTRGTAWTILVLDASGALWGQIDGVNKIVIARLGIAPVFPSR